MSAILPHAPYHHDYDALCADHWSPDAHMVSVAEQALGQFLAARRALEASEHAGEGDAFVTFRAGHVLHPLRAEELRIIESNFALFDETGEDAASARPSGG